MVFEKYEYYLNRKRQNYFKKWHFMENKIEVLQQPLKVQ